MANTLLIEAVKAGDDQEVARLLSLGRDVNEKGNEQEWTPLNFAAGKGNLSLIRLLLDSGADVFQTGTDNRTPYLIALAAGHVDACRILRDAEERSGGDTRQVSSRACENRPYCKAYELQALRQFAHWTENEIEAESTGEADEAGDGGACLKDDDVVYIHQDYVVTRSIWHDKEIIFDRVDERWKEFCRDSLDFKVPHDFDLVAK
jgi:ankyrin repeat protein